MSKEDVRKAQAKKRFDRIQKAVKEIIPSLYKISSEVYVEARKRSEAYRIAQGMQKGEPICQAAADGIIKELFAEKDAWLFSSSKEIGSRTIRKYSLSCALEAWIFTRAHLMREHGVIQGVPIVWKALDLFFQQFLSADQMAALLEMDEEEKRAAEIKDAIKDGKEIPAPQAVLDFKSKIEKMHEGSDA